MKFTILQLNVRVMCVGKPTLGGNHQRPDCDKKPLKGEKA